MLFDFIGFWFLMLIQGGIGLQKLSPENFIQYTAEKQWSKPACILIYDGNTAHLKKFQQASSKLANHAAFQHVEFYELHNKQVEYVDDSVVKCYLGRSEPKLFTFRRKKNLVKWMESLDLNVGFNMINNADINELSKRDKVTVIIVMPGDKFFRNLEGLFENIILSNDEEEIDVNFVPPNTKIERILLEKLQLEMFPSVLFYCRKYHHQPLHLYARLSGPYEVTEEFIKLQLLLQKIRHLQITPELLEIHLTNHHHLPVVLCVYSSSSALSFRYLHAFYRTTLVFKKIYKSARIKFALVDISKSQNSLTLARHLLIYHVPSIPFTLCLHLKDTQEIKAEIQQHILKNGTMPNVHTMEIFLKTLDLLQRASLPFFSAWLPMMCSANHTAVCLLGDKPPEVLHSEIQTKFPKMQIKKTKKLGRLDLITESTWDNVFVAEDQVSAYVMLKGNTKQQSKLFLVIFISSGCSFCKLALPQFQKVAKSAHYLHGISVFLMNCSNSFGKCVEYNVTGYPTLLLFRFVSTYKHNPCLPHKYLTVPTKIDYHGIFEADDILKWLSEQTLPILKYITSNNIYEQMSKDIRLTAKVYNRDFVRRYLPRSLKDRLLPLHCFLVICELLYSQVECFASPEKGLNLSENENELVVSSLDFKRSDGAQLTVLKTGIPIERTLAEESSTRRTFFHDSHKYSIPHGFTCEDDHLKCTEITLEFIIDHIRLPITRVTTAMFHTHQKGNSYMWSRPMLLSLAHTGNITVNSSFYLQLYNVAVRLYKDVNVAVLDVDEHPHWANLFVPRGYYRKYFDLHEVPPLQQYPRFCIIDLEDHNHAAFFPRLPKKQSSAETSYAHITGQFNASEIEDFVNVYLRDRNSVVLETEHF